MNQISSRKPKVNNAASRIANDNRSIPSGCSILDLIANEDDFADLSRRAERRGIAIVIAMAICLILAPVVYFVLV
ncbi:hypothetical protein JQK88_22020 [Mesorhizobium caraganae]|uniref:hypothetical protein n=1 Tax=Mesorhizobium caraganae TaxID=483206 RepID=UPI00177AB4C7|nr:hypothetical protein [Mesorhizobium caraganae]MBM2713843.1 hypothetical protein [Mesorhizobium caraganae]